MMERGLARITDRLVAVSELVKEDLIAYGVAPPEKISVNEMSVNQVTGVCSHKLNQSNWEQGV